MKREFPLTLRPLATARRITATAPQSGATASSAWLITGDDPADWLAEMARWASLTAIRLLIVPKSLSDRRAIGVLALVDAENFLPAARPSPAVLPYRLVGERLYIPQDSELFPQITAAELGRILLHDIQVLHPAAGLIGYAQADVLRPADLLQPPPRRREIWSQARPGVRTAPRLLSVESDTPPTLASILDSGRDDIGSRADKDQEALDANPPSDFAAKFAGPLQRLLSWITGAAGRGAGSPRGSERLQQAREQELARLLEMLDKHPDQGLKYAIPMAPVPMRGIGPPSGKLGPRDADFSLSRLRGAVPADPWNVPWQIRQKLLAQYRAAANRELALGRHRRAAYIFAELLGDFSGAASALRAGGHYREAAALFRDPLRNVRAAAQCLEQGGLLIEAVAIYEELRAWSLAGAVYERLERPEDARRCYRAAVAELHQRGEPLAAAALLEKKLASPQEALQVLIDAWPARDPAGLCLAESFELMGRMGKHAEAGKRVRSLARQSFSARHVPQLAQSLSGVARLYPDSAVRVLAADATRVVVGQQLVAYRPNPAENVALLQTITRTDPQDRLLLRDANRFAHQSSARAKPYPLALPPRIKPRRTEPGIVASFHFPSSIWHSAVCQGETFYALGHSGEGQRLVRGNFQGETQSINLFGIKDAQMVLTPRRVIPQMIVVSRGQVLDDNLTMPASHCFAPLIIGRPAWLSPAMVRGLCFNEADEAFVLTEDAGLRLASYSASSGNLISGFALPDLQGQVMMVAQKRQVFVAADRMVLQISQNLPTAFDLPHPARGIAASPVFTRLRIAVAMSEGVLVLWPGGDHQIIADLLIDPVATFLRSGILVVISADAGRAYRTSDGKAVHISSFPGSGNRPIAVLSGESENAFAVITSDGAVNLYQADFV